MEEKKWGLLSGNHLKLIAAFTMLLDHAGLLLFPHNTLFRILGRLAFPIYAYMIAEGCRYTKNKLRYFLSVFGLGAACQIVYYFAMGDTYLSILITFSISILLIYLLQAVKRALTEKSGGAALYLMGFCGCVAAVWVLDHLLAIDYGFWGIMTPVLCALFREKGKTGRCLPVLMMAVSLSLLVLDYGGAQWYALLSLPLLLLYSGKRGKHNLKYFFYIFYPVHLVVLQGIAMLLG